MLGTVVSASANIPNLMLKLCYGTETQSFQVSAKSRLEPINHLLLSKCPVSRQFISQRKAAQGGFSADQTFLPSDSQHAGVSCFFHFRVFYYVSLEESCLAGLLVAHAYPAAYLGTQFRCLLV